MVRRLQVALGVLATLAALPFLLLLWYDQSRQFYCAGDKCITVWKRVGGTCYVVNGKYYNVVLPQKRSYLKTTTDEGFSFYFNRTMPRNIIVEDKEKSLVAGKYFTVVNVAVDDMQFIPYSEQYRLLLFSSTTPFKTKLTADTNAIYVDIFEGYATIWYGDKQ